MAFKTKVGKNFSKQLITTVPKYRAPGIFGFQVNAAGL